MTKKETAAFEPILPDKTIGSVKIESFDVRDEFLAWKQHVPPGRYTRLLINGCLYMSNTPEEKRWNARIRFNAHGDVLIAGLGLGVILPDVMERAKTVTIVENNADVITAVAPHFPSVNVIHSDIHKWRPRRLYDVIYFDIWPDMCIDNLPEIATLHRRFARALNRDNPKAWMDSWACDILRAKRRRERRCAW